jgi:hypothetical protein
MQSRLLGACTLPIIGAEAIVFGIVRDEVPLVMAAGRSHCQVVPWQAVTGSPSSIKGLGTPWTGTEHQR